MTQREAVNMLAEYARLVVRAEYAMDRDRTKSQAAKDDRDDMRDVLVAALTESHYGR